MQQYRVNYTLLIGLIVGTLVVSAATFGLHRFQLNRNADALIASAEQAEKEGDLRSAAQDYTDYLSIRRDDEDVRVKLGDLWVDITEQADRRPEDIGLAIAYLEDLLRTKPEEKELRQRVVEMY